MSMVVPLVFLPCTLQEKAPSVYKRQFMIEEQLHFNSPLYFEHESVKEPVVSQYFSSPSPTPFNLLPNLYKYQYFPVSVHLPLCSPPFLQALSSAHLESFTPHPLIQIVDVNDE